MRARIVIPTLNAGPGFRELLRSLRGQREAGAIAEIVVIDSSSTDGTPGVAAQFDARVISIAQSEFNHGATRNRAAAGGGVDAIVFLVQDAVPADDRFLGALLAPFADPRVAGTMARVVARPGATPLVARDVASDLVAGLARLRKQIDDPEDYKSWSPEERRVFCHFNNVASAVRASVFESMPFWSVPFGEDLDWGKRAIEAGHAIVYAPDAVVVHSHESGLARDFARHRDDSRIERQLFGIVKPPSLPRAVARALRTMARDAASNPPVFSPAIRLAQSLGRWRGAVSK
jgi:rhamnosyltransferase